MNNDKMMYIIAAITLIVNLPHLLGLSVSNAVGTIIWIIDLLLIIAIIIITFNNFKKNKK